MLCGRFCGVTLEGSIILSKLSISTLVVSKRSSFILVGDHNGVSPGRSYKVARPALVTLMRFLIKDYAHLLSGQWEQVRSISCVRYLWRAVSD